MSVNFASNISSTQTISITSGKGGVGKTSIVANVALSLAAKGKRVLILDGDLGMANVDLMFGKRAQNHILDVLHGGTQIEDIVLPLAENISLVPGGNGVYEFNRLSAFERRAMLDVVTSLNEEYDYLLIDTAPGTADSVLFLNSAADICSVIITPEPASFADSYALIKLLNKHHGAEKFSIICNNVQDPAEGRGLFERFSEVVSRFLYVGLDYWGAVPSDPQLRRSTRQQCLIMKQNPGAPSAQAIDAISLKILDSRQICGPQGGLKFFWEQLVGVA